MIQTFLQIKVIIQHGETSVDSSHVIFCPEDGARTKHMKQDVAADRKQPKTVEFLKFQ